MLMSLLFIFKSNKVIPGIIFIGSLAVPFSLLMMFFEINVYQNISVRQAMIIFLVGGILSLIVTMTFYMILPIRTEISIESAFIVGLVEELAKCVVIILFINAYKANYIVQRGFRSEPRLVPDSPSLKVPVMSVNMDWVTIFYPEFPGHTETHTIWAAIIGGCSHFGLSSGKKHFTMKDFFTKPKVFRTFS